ncbi:MAG: hypothetical protein U1A25_00505 [Candidatus Sungbacteria bacterium]|nr:hypothetical protein [bacterium]MDZ4260125.1 hypothetical protein [Candidatus Sungbacteria bacterium]
MNADKWLADVASEARKIPLPERPYPRVTAYITSPISRYGIGQELGRCDRFTMYECVRDGNIPGILKIANSIEHNEFLDREALVLKMMSAKAAELETEYAGKTPLHYENFFPVLTESFIAENQDKRRINILGFANPIEMLGQLTPVYALREIERVRVDPRTGAWILGKTLKVLSFAHVQGISNGLVTRSNILIERDMHGLIFFDWTHARIYHTHTVPSEVIKKELSEAGYIVTLALGGNPETGELPHNDQLVDGRFKEFLHRLTCGGMVSASRAHRDFYILIRALWPRGFHRFTTYDLEEGV